MITSRKVKKTIRANTQSNATLSTATAANCYRRRQIDPAYWLPVTWPDDPEPVARRGS